MRNIPFGKPIIGDEEKAAVIRVMESGRMVHGPVTKDFEEGFQRMVGGGHSVSVGSCTAGLHLVYMALGIEAGDEVIVPAQTHIATAHSVEFVGATPVFVDCELQTGNIDLDAVEAAITDKTRAISLVHYLGFPVDMGRLRKIAAGRELPIVEDAALAIGTRYDGVHAGLLGSAGCFSFYPVKHMTTAEGGMVVTRDEKMAEQISLLRAFGVDRTYSERKIPGVYETVALGYNYRMNELEAAIGVEQLKRIDGFASKRAQNFNTLQSALEKAEHIQTFIRPTPPFESSYYCFQVLLEPTLAPQRPAIINALKERGVGTSVYYPAPVPRMLYYREKYGYDAGRFPNAARISDSSIALPVGPHLDEADMLYIVENLREVLLETVNG